MRKLFALAAVATFALTLTLGVIGCAKTEQTSTEGSSTTTETAPPPAETPAAPESAGVDTTSHM
jgi:hypothetical protein